MRVENYKMGGFDGQDRVSALEYGPYYMVVYFSFPAFDYRDCS